MNDVESKGVESLFQEVSVLEKEFKSILDRQTPYAVDVLTLLKKIRQQAENVLFADIEYALGKAVIERLWTHVHYRAIDDYRKRQANHEKQYGTSRPVENRKLIDHYTRFLKDTTNFYRSLIQRLVSHFNVVELHPIVRQFRLEVDVPSEAPKFQSKKIKALVFTVVQSCLIKLGDISRYRALTPARTKAAPKPDYGPAYGYYVLAQTLLPDNGAPANQLAVLSTYSKDFLASTYYFYRALACDEPFITAGNNLALGFRKILRDGVDVDGVEREDVGVLIDAFLRMHAQFYNQQESFDDPAIIGILEDVIKDRAVEAKFLNRLTFINLSALYVAIQREQTNVAQFLNTILAQYSLLLRLLRKELDTAPTSTDPQSYITAIVRRTTPSLRLYTKWVVLHHSQIPLSFWPQFISFANSLQKVWRGRSRPTLSYPLEEDLAAAGFAPLETPQDTGKRKHKQDRARIGNRKKRFDRLLLRWGQSGGDSTVTSSRDHGAEHPNVEMTLRLADLLSDAVDIATIPASPIELVSGLFSLQEVEPIRGEEQIISTGFPTEALGRMGLDEADSDERSFSEPQESSEDELGMAFSPTKMVDDIVGEYHQPERPPTDHDEEEIIFRGRATRKQLYTPVSFILTSSRSDPVVNHSIIPSPILLPSSHAKTPSPMPSPISASQEHLAQPKTVADLMIQAFPNRLSGSSQSPRSLPLPPHQIDDSYNPIPSGSRMGLHHFEDSRRREESSVGVIGQGRASPRRAGAGGSPRWI